MQRISPQSAFDEFEELAKAFETSNFIQFICKLYVLKVGG
jgi:hypothetical protein